MEESTDSGSERKIGIVAGKFVASDGEDLHRSQSMEGSADTGKSEAAHRSLSDIQMILGSSEDWKAFYDFLRNHQPPRSLSECTADDAVEFLSRLPSDRIEAVIVSLSAANFFAITGNHNANPFSSPIVRRFLKERVKEQTSEIESLPEGYESEIMGRQDDDRENLLEKCLTDKDVGKQNPLVIAADDAGKHTSFAAVLGGTTKLLSFEDEDGKPWKINCSYIRKSYVFRKGWVSYVREKQLRAGDFVFFQRHRWDSIRFFIGCRRRNDGDAALGQWDKVSPESISPTTFSVQGRSALGQRHYVLPDPTAPATSSVQGCSTLREQDNVLPDPTSPATSFVNGGAAPGNWGYVLPDPTSSEMLELREKIKEVETPLQLRLPEHSNTGFDPILVIFCGDNQDSEETYFISYIFNELCLRGFAPLRYDLTRSTVTGDPEMLYGSRVGIMIFSENYARSRECLDGFVAIMDHLKANKLELIPVFFKVSLSDVMNQSGSLGTAFLQLGKSVQASHVQKWRDAMIKLTSINGYLYMKGHEAKNIVRDVCLLLNSETNGIKLALESILPLLHCSQPSAPHIVGLWGMAGIGKTTIAREIFRTQAEIYDVCYFLPDFHIMCQTKGLNHLRDDFFSKIFGEENVFIDACDTKLSFTRDRFLDKRVLIVLDGVSNARDAEFLVGGFGWFSGGHTVILTSRNRQVLVQCNAKEIYEIPKLSEPESLRLCCQFATEQNWKGRMSLISELVSYASGNPLALRVLGSSIQKQGIYDEKQHLKRLRQHPVIEIQDAFRRSFNILDDNEKNTFLDLACFFRGENKDRVVNILDGCGFLTDLEICGLIDESLISLVDNRIEMPNIFQDTGRFIVSQEYEEAGKRSRLWDSDDIADVLTNKIGTEAIEGIFFDTSRLTLELSSTVFEKMYRLRLLKLYCQTFTSRVCLPQGLHSLPDELRLLHWERYPLDTLPWNFNPKNLVELNMPYSNMTKLWKGTKNLEKLKRIILSHSRQLTEFPRLSKARNLEHIDLEGCTSLVKVNSSILHHHKLTFLSLKDCSHLRIMPTTVHLESLEVLNLSGCSVLENLQDFSPNLKELYLAGTAISEMPSSLEDLTRLVTLDLENCKRLQHLPPGISNLKAVVTLSAKRPAASMDLSSVEDMAPPYKRCRLKRLIESVILSLRKRKRQTSISRATNQVQLDLVSTSVNDLSYKSFWGFHVLPERPGQPECQYYMSTGDCKFGNACKFHHPRDREACVSESSEVSESCLTSEGLPSRPGKRLCALYSRTGDCSSGLTCIFDHPTLESTHKNTSSKVSQTQYMNLLGISLTL